MCIVLLYGSNHELKFSPKSAGFTLVVILSCLKSQALVVVSLVVSPNQLDSFDCDANIAFLSPFIIYLFQVLS